MDLFFYSLKKPYNLKLYFSQKRELSTKTTSAYHNKRMESISNITNPKRN